MANLGYSPLKEDPCPPQDDQLPVRDQEWTAKFDDDIDTSLATAPQPQNQYGGMATSPSKQGGTSSNSSPQKDHDNVKYTALKPTSIQELDSHDEDPEDVQREQDMYDSCVRIGLTSAQKKKTFRLRFVLCALVCACVALVACVLIYVFVILPAHKGTIVYSDGRTHNEDLLALHRMGENVAVTSCGLVKGTKENNVHVFRGIPYALPPTGDRRWRPPVGRDYDSKTCWHDVYNATQFGHKCVQPKFDDTRQIEGREDCLYVNVWTPYLNPDTLLPVMVWLHSGDFVYGSGHMPGMTPNTEIALATNSVYVSINYRLGVFGFLALDELREETRGAAGNYGFMDQQLALRWVQDNIRHFGGNENSVTIFGHGSGATSIQALLSSPASAGLFHRAWMTSPVALLNKTLGEACKDNKVFMTKTGCKSASCLRHLSPEVVSKASPWQLEPYWTLDQLFSIPDRSQIRNDLAIFDGHVVHHTSITQGPEGPVVPVILGSSYFDMSSLKSEQQVVNMTWDDYDDTLVHYLSQLSTEAAIRVKALYSDKVKVEYTSPARFPPMPSAHFARLLGDIKTVCPVRLVADDLNYLYGNNTPVYMYVAEIYPSHNMKLADNIRDTFVGWDILAFFNTFGDIEFLAGQGDINFQNILRQEVMTFVKDGKPDAARWQPLNINVGIIGRDVTVSPAQTSYFNKCRLWKELGFQKYTWSLKNTRS